VKALAACALFVFGCSGAANTRVSLGDVTQAPPQPYPDVLKKWTRHGHIVDDFDETLQLDATLHAPELRSSYIERWVVMFKVGAADAARIRSEWMREIADIWEVHIEASTHDFGLNNFSAKRTPWRMVLVDDQGNEMLPREITSSPLRREVEVAMYPYANLFSKGWRVRFPRMRNDGTPFITDATKWIALRIAGPAGHTDLTWQIAKN
jgi:hypothetical protein